MSCTSLLVICVPLLLNLQGLASSEVVVDVRRPIYNIAHMVNSIPEVSYYLDRGANVIETDVTFGKNGTGSWVYHGTPCDCFRHCDNREELSTYLNYIRELTSPGDPKFRPELVMLFMDLKVGLLNADYQTHAGNTLALQLLNHLWIEDVPESQVYVLLSLSDPSDQVVTAVLDTLNTYLLESFIQKRIGWDIGRNDDLSEIDAMWDRLGINNNAWLSDGRTNCLSYLSSDKRLKQALDEREVNPRISKVYTWTVDFTFNIRSALRLGVDGIITNHPERLREIILEDPEFVSQLRLATSNDDPWKIVFTVASLRSLQTTSDLSIVVDTTMEKVGSLWKFLKDGNTRFQNYLEDDIQ